MKTIRRLSNKRPTRNNTMTFNNKTATTLKQITKHFQQIIHQHAVQTDILAKLHVTLVHHIISPKCHQLQQCQQGVIMATPDT